VQFDHFPYPVLRRVLKQQPLLTLLPVYVHPKAGTNRSVIWPVLMLSHSTLPARSSARARVSIRPIVDVRLASLTNVIILSGRRHRSDSSAMSSMLDALSSWLAVLSMWLPFHSGLCQLGSPAITLVVRVAQSLCFC
jgi:hypothetical protein